MKWCHGFWVLCWFGAGSLVGLLGNAAEEEDPLAWTRDFETAPAAAPEGTVPGGPAAPLTVGTANISQPEMEAIELAITRQLDEALGRLLQPERLAQQLGFAWPVPAATRAVKNVEQDIDRALDKELQQKFPKSRSEEFLAEAEKLYGAYVPQAEHKITVYCTDGREITGYFRQRDDQGITIDALLIKYSELKDESAVHFLADVAAEAKAKYVRGMQAQLSTEKAEYARLNRARIERMVYSEAGYLQLNSEWVRKADFFEKQLEDRRQMLTTRLRSLLELKVCADHGYVPYEGHYLKKEEVERLVREEAFDEVAFQAELDNLNADRYTVTGGGEAGGEEGGNLFDQ